VGNRRTLDFKRQAWPGLYRVSLALCADLLLVPTGALQVRFVYGCAAA